MRKLCAISGLTLTTASHFSNYFTRSVHPIMEVKTEQLIELIGTKSFFEWQDEEAKLLFLALANSMEMLEVTTPAIANPSPQVIASSIENLVAIAGWHTVRQFPLPCYHITTTTESTPSNERMQEFPQLLNSIIATREETRESDRLALEALRLEEVIKILYSKCSIGANKTKMLRTKAADWAIKITAQAARKERVDAATSKLWHTMLITAPVDAYKFARITNGKDNYVDILELDEFMTCNLPHGCTASYEVMKHLTAMKNATTDLGMALGISSIIQVIPQIKDAPVESAFSTKLEFLIAKAQFQQRVANAASSVEAADSISYTEVPEQELAISEEESDDELLSEEGTSEGEDDNEYGI